MSTVPMEPLDTRLTITTPEYVRFHHQLAGPFRRLVAYGIDLLIRGVILTMFLSIVSFLGVVAGESFAALGPVLVAYFLLDWFYGAFFETWRNGQTPGKEIVGIRALSGDGRPLNGEQALLRNLLRAADILPFLFLTGAVCMVASRRFQRLGDLVADTIVVVERFARPPRPLDVAEPRALDVAGRLPAGFAPGRELRRALASYAARRGRYSVEQRRRLAAPLGAALERQLGLDERLDPDLLLCGLYYRSFQPDLVNPSPPRNKEAPGNHRAAPAASATGASRPPGEEG